MIKRNNWWKPLLHRKIDGLKKKFVYVLVKPTSAYGQERFQDFLFEGWISLPINNKVIYFKRHLNKTYPWYHWSIKGIIRNNWKYFGIKENEFELDCWYIVKFDFVNRIIATREY
jgi:hypothetical protein